MAGLLGVYLHGALRHKKLLVNTPQYFLSPHDASEHCLPDLAFPVVGIAFVLTPILFFANPNPSSKSTHKARATKELIKKRSF